VTAARIPEAFVAWLWETRQLDARLFVQGGSEQGSPGQKGRRLQVVYPGRRAGSWGPDFHGALLAFDGVLAHGDVEVHVHARDWHVHGHGADPAYANTILHVVFSAEAALPTVGLDGAVIPTIVLEPMLAEPIDLLLARWTAASGPPEPIACRTPEEAVAVLQRAGIARFTAKAARYEGDFTWVDPPQALWTGLFEALGYSANVSPFRRLADRVTLLEARTAATAGPLPVMALLLGEAGLLPHQRGRFALDDYAEDLERLWHASRRYGPIASLPWRVVGVRPGNGPVRRVAAAATLLLDEAKSPLHQRVLGALSELPREHAPRALRALVACAGDEYWHAHADLGRLLRRPAALVGPDRAADIVVNVLLPWAAAVGRRQRNEDLVSAAEAVYQRHPRLSANEITRHMARQIIGTAARGIVRTACLQQGLIHIYRGWCDQRDCAACPAGPPRGGPTGVEGRESRVSQDDTY
jgi:hypothetical protein